MRRQIEAGEEQKTDADSGSKLLDKPAAQHLENEETKEGAENLRRPSGSLLRYEEADDSVELKDQPADIDYEVLPDSVYCRNEPGPAGGVGERGENMADETKELSEEKKDQNDAEPNDTNEIDSNLNELKTDNKELNDAPSKNNEESTGPHMFPINFVPSDSALYDPLSTITPSKPPNEPLQHLDPGIPPVDEIAPCADDALGIHKNNFADVQPKDLPKKDHNLGMPTDTPEPSRPTPNDGPAAETSPDSIPQAKAKSSTPQLHNSALPKTNLPSAPFNATPQPPTANLLLPSDARQNLNLRAPVQQTIHPPLPLHTGAVRKGDAKYEALLAKAKKATDYALGELVFQHGAYAKQFVREALEHVSQLEY